MYWGKKKKKKNHTVCFSNVHFSHHIQLISSVKAKEDCTVSYVAVASVLDDVAEMALDPLVASEVKCVGWAGPQHCDVEASERPQDTLGADDPLEGLVHTPVLGLWVWLKALHPCLIE